MSVSGSKEKNHLSGRIVVADGYVHDSQQGRVQCEHCGSRAFSRNTEAIAQWEHAHRLCCKGSNEFVPTDN